MQPLKLTTDTSAMMKIGSVANLGSEVIEGNPEASVQFLVGNPETNIAVGLFGCTKGVFRMVYPFTEHATVLSGKVTLQNEATGETESYQAGDSWYFEKGTAVLWTVESDDFVKNYMSIVEG
ncbi:cupin domain-containing protein [Oceanobacter mangrovi]|uniref:cupin domain-containing protein n=1 Tax=Oceanobacter mangrovi TaxID=2862510 RepID=UPI001C8D9581|nr:cupin domain-containing protein [Oceanobacter mangrovi]